MMRHMVMRLLLVIAVGVSIMLMAVSAYAKEENTVLWSSAQDAYVRGDYAMAVTLFDSIVSINPHSATAMYNLANSYIQIGDIAHAVLFYERALRIRPGDRDILHNLSIARERRTNPVVEIHSFFLRRWMLCMSGLLPPLGWGLLSLVLFWLTVGFISYRMWSSTWVSRDKVWIMLFALVFVVCTIFGAFRLKEMARSDEAVVLLDEVVVTTAPDVRSLHVAQIGAGEKLRILDTLDGHFKVRLANFEQGWIPMDVVERI